MGWNGVTLLGLDRDLKEVLVNMLIKFYIPQRTGRFSTNLKLLGCQEELCCMETVNQMTELYVRHPITLYNNVKTCVDGIESLLN